MRVAFVAPASAADALAECLRSAGVHPHVMQLWSGAGCEAPAPHGKPNSSSLKDSLCVDSFLLGCTDLKPHLAAATAAISTSCELLLCATDSCPDTQLAARGVLLLVQTPHVPQDVILACQQLPSGLSVSALRGLVCLDASPSLTTSVLQKALEAQGLQHVGRNTIVMTARGPALQAAAAAVLQLAEPLTARPPPSPPVPGTHTPVRIAIAHDAAFRPRFSENLTLLAAAGAQLVPFSPMYDTSLPSGIACLYLCGGPLDSEHLGQLCSNRQLLAHVRAFCHAGGHVLAEGAGLVYLCRSVQADDGCAHRVHDAAGLLPFKAALLPAPRTGNVQLEVLPGNPLLPAGARPRGYLCSQAALVEERVVAGLGLGVGLAEGPLPGAPEDGLPLFQPHLQQQLLEGVYRTTYRACLQPDGRAALPAAAAVPEQCGAKGAAAPVPVAAAQQAAVPEGYASGNVLASNAFLYLPSAPELALHWVAQCAAVDTHALGLAVEQALLRNGLGLSLGSNPGAGKLAGSRGASRRQSMQDCSVLLARAHQQTATQLQLQHHYQDNGHAPPVRLSPRAGTVAHDGSAGGVRASVECAMAQEQQQQRVYSLQSGLLQPSGAAVRCRAESAPRSTACEAASTVANCHLYVNGMAGCGALDSNAAEAALEPDSNAQQQQRAKAQSHPAGLPPRGAPGPAPSVPLAPGGQAGEARPQGLLGPGSSQGAVPPWSRHASQGLLLRQVQAGAELQAVDTPVAGLCAEGQARACGVRGFSSPGLPMPAGGQLPLPPLPDGGNASTLAHMYSSTPELANAAAAGQHAASTGVSHHPHHQYNQHAHPHHHHYSNPPYHGGGMSAPQPPEFDTYAQLGGAPAVVPRPLTPGTSRFSHERELLPRQPQHAAAYTTHSAQPTPHAHGHHNNALLDYGGTPTLASFSAGSASSSMQGLVDAHVSASISGGSAARLSAVPAGQGICCLCPGACEAVVAMGLGSRLLAISADCSYPADICTSRRVVAAWLPQGSRGFDPRLGLAAAVLAAKGTPQPPVPSTPHAAAAGGAGCAGGLGAGGRLMAVDVDVLRHERPGVLVLPSLDDLGPVGQRQLGLTLAAAGCMQGGGADAAGGAAGGAGMVLHMTCRTLCDCLDAMAQIGYAAGAHDAAAALQERLQTRMRRLAAAAAVADAGSGGEGPAARPRVLVLSSLQPMVEPGRWVPELLALAGAAPNAGADDGAVAGGSDTELSWAQLRARAPDVLLVMVEEGAGAPGTGTGADACGSAALARLAALAALPGWWSLPAVRTSRVYALRAPYLTRAGPRLLDGAEVLARLLRDPPGAGCCGAIGGGSIGAVRARKLPPGALLKLSLAPGQRCRATLLPSYFVPVTL